MKNTVITCENSHRLFPDIDEIEDILETTSCPLCGGKIESITPPTIEVGCPICNWSDRANLNDAICWLHEGCPNCGGIEEKFSKVHLLGSSWYTLSDMQAYRPFSEKNVSELTRDGRPDYWEILIHFCQVDELVSILDQRTIFASPTGYYQLPAVCLTETPLEFAEDIRKIHGGFGIAFRKGTIIRSGGMPALYVIESLMAEQESNGGFCGSIKPFVNILRLRGQSPTRKRYDYLHEREWRIDKNIEFDEISPIGIVLPEALNPLTVPPEFIEKLRDYSREFGEISIKSINKSRREGDVVD